MANEENLIPMNERTKEEQRKIARQGGIASGKVRKQNADMKKRLKEIANMALREGKIEEEKKMSNKMYDVLKWIAMVVLPAIATLYFALAGIWGIPYAEEIVGTISAIDTFLGVLLGISSAQYYKRSE